MTRAREEGHEIEDARLSDAYREAVGGVVAARALHTQACTDQGPESSAAIQAQEHLTRAIDHRNQVREQYGAILDRPSPR